MTARMWIWPRYALEVGGKRVEVSDKQGAVLARLFTARERVSTNDLIDTVYFDDPEGGPLCADICIRAFAHRLRKNLRTIRASVRGSQKLGGYRLHLP